MYTSRKSLIKSIEYLMKNFPVVAILGARQVGKSTLVNEICANQGHVFDLESEKDLKRIEDPELLFKEAKPPYFFDEAQLSPELFKAIRVEVDKTRQINGRFLLSGSSSPLLIKNISETLAGRIAILEISTFDWAECKNQKQSKFYTALENLDELLKLKPLYSHADLLDFCLHGGYPEPFLKRDNRTFYDLWFTNYFKTYIERDVASLFPNLNLDAFKRFIRMISTATGEIINASNFARSLDVSQPTIKKYLEIMEGTFLWRKLSSYEGSETKRVVKMPKGHIRDTGLINYLLNIHTVSDLKGHQQYGRIWESFVIEQILKGLETNLIKHNAYFYRTNNQNEIDLILEGRFGIIPIEIKSGSSTSKKDLKTLETFITKHNLPFGIVVNNGDEIFKISEKIIQIPAIFL